MSLIRKSTELNIPTNVKMMIYGQAGMGKSTVALSAPKPLLVDFDNGVKRMNMAHLENIDTVQVTSWNDVQLVLQEDLSVWVPGCVPDYFLAAFGRFAPYLERACILPETPCVSRVPRTIW